MLESTAASLAPTAGELVGLQEEDAHAAAPSKGSLRQVTAAIVGPDQPPAAEIVWPTTPMLRPQQFAACR